jgi:glutamyl/glutaminyl-tRNA synthetase
MDYKSEGYIPEAMFNFLALMGWHPKEDRELISREEAVDEFSLKRVQKSGAGYDETKLEWYNSHYIQSLSPEKIVSYLSEFIPSSWKDKQELLKKAVEAEQERMKRLTDFKELANFFFELPDYSADMLIWKENRAESIKSLKKVYEFVQNLDEDEFNKEKVEQFLLDLSDEFGGKGEVFWPFRVALSGKKASPGGLDILEVLGKEESERRLKKAVEKSEGLHMLD